MSPNKLILAIVCLILLPSWPSARSQATIDTVLIELAKTHDDTTRLQLLRRAIEGSTDAKEQARLADRMTDLARSLSAQGLARAKRIALDHLAWNEYRLAFTGSTSADPMKQLGHLSMSYDLLGKDGDPDLRASVLDALAQVHMNAGNEQRALDYANEALRWSMATHDTALQVGSLGRIGRLHMLRQDFASALIFQQRGLRLAEQKRDTGLMIDQLTGLHASYFMLSDTAQQDRCSALAVRLADTPNWMERLPSALVMRGTDLSTIGHDPNAGERTLLRVVRTCEDLIAAGKIGEFRLQAATTLYNLAMLHLKMGQGSRSMQEIQRALDHARAMGDPATTLNMAGGARTIYEAMGMPTEALEMAELQLQMRDSMDLSMHSGELERFEYQKQLLGDSLAHVAERAVHSEEVHREKNRRNVILLSAVAVLLVALALWNRLRYVRRARKEADRLRQRAEASEKFKQQFLANMSHEIRTPMNAIMGMTGILKRNEQLPEQRKYLDAIAQSSENLLVILNDILDLSKLEAGRIDLEQVPFDPRQVIGNVRDILRFRAEEKGVALAVDVAEGVPAWLRGDPTRLNQIVLNLAGNAIKFTEHGSVTITGTWSDGTLSIAVTDTGIGIPQDRLDKIFEEFTQAYSDTTRKYGGTGLGLTISKRLAELQGGSITVRSEQGEGSTFTVTIPYAIADQQVTRATDDQQLTSDNLKDLRILLAEDNDFNAMVAQDELADAIPGVQVDVAANGRIAVEMVQANDYDVVLMDVQMPEMNGYDATMAIRALPGDKSRTPIVAMTANVMKEEVERCVEAGMDGYVPKPFKREELVSALHQALRAVPTRS